MNQKTEKMLAAEMSNRNRIISYAPVASTRGDRVKIYRYGFEQIGSEYRNLLERELHPMRKAIIRYEWASFILNHIDEYSGNKDIFYRSASVLASTAYLDAKRLRAGAERELRNAQECLRRAEKRAGVARKVKKQETTKGLTAEQQRELDDLRYNLKLCHRHQNELMTICTDSIFERIRKLAENSNSYNK
jgi:hypothetical protein